MSKTQYQLIVQKGPQPGKLLLLMIDSITIGRDPMADISINDPEVSRQHVRLTQTASGYVLEDLGSTNGTFIDGEKLEPDTPIVLVPGQTVGMGSGVTLLYEVIKPEPEAPPEPEPLPEIFDAFSPALPDPVLEEEAFEPIFEESPEFPEALDAMEPPPPAPQASAPEASTPLASTPQAPLVPPGNSEQQKKRRRMITIAVVSLILLCCCCLAFMLSAYYYWGDPFMQSLGLY